MASTLIIGIGTTGLNIIEEAQQWHYEFTGKNKPDKNVEYLFFETDLNAKPKTTPLGTSDIKEVYIDLKRHDATIHSLREDANVDNEWVPDVEQLLFAGTGAGWMSSYGRLALWDSTNFMRVHSEINDAYIRINGDSNTKIIIVGSLLGGTGSGLCVDIAYLTRKITNNSNVEGIFLLPPEVMNNIDSEKLKLNAYSALAAIDYYTNIENKYSVNWPNIGKLESKNPPYKYIQYLSVNFFDATSQLNFDELLKLAGLTLLLNFIDSNVPNINLIRDQINAQRVNGNEHHNTIGLKMIQYPVKQMEELFALNESKIILNSWIDKTHFFDHGIKKEISAIDSIINNETPKDIENIIEKSFDVLKSIKGPDNLMLFENLNSNIDNIILKNTGTYKIPAYIYSLFTTTLNSSYYHIFKNNSYLLRDSIIYQIIEYIDKKTDDYENIEVSKKFLKAVVDGFKNLIGFYTQNYKIQINGLSWDNRLKEIIEMLLADKTKYVLINQKKEFYSFLFTEIIEYLSIYTLVFELDKIIEAIEGGSTLKTIQRSELPTFELLEKFTDIVTKVINSDEKNTKSIKRRLREIENVLNDDKIKLIFYVYNYGNWKTDFKKAGETYASMPNKPKTRDLTISSLYSYLHKISKTNNDDLYSNFVGKFVQEITSRSLFSNIDIIHIIQNLDNNSIRNVELKNLYKANCQSIREKLPPLVRIKTTDEFIIASNALLYVFHDKVIGNNQGILPNCQPAPMQHAYIDTPSFKDVIIFYQEYGYMGNSNGVDRFYKPLVNNSFVDLYKRDILKCFNSTAKMKHVPYLSEKEFKNNYLK